MNYQQVLIAGINTNDCRNVPMLESAAQTIYGYANGLAGISLAIIGVILLLGAVFSKKVLAALPGQLGAKTLAVVAIPALFLVLPAFGVNIGCGGGGGTSSEVTPPAETVPASGETQP